VLRAFTDAEDESRPWLQRALEVSGRVDLSDQIRPLLESGNPLVIAAAIEVLAFRRASIGPALARLCRHDVSEVRRAALHAARLWPTQVEPALVHNALASPNGRLREAAIQVGLLKGIRAAWQACQALSEVPGAQGHLPRLLLACGGDGRDLQHLLRLLETSNLRRDVLWALGFSGRLVAAQACLPYLRDPHLGGVAAEAFSAITGLALEGRFVTRRAAEELPLWEEALDLELRPGPDADLPTPDASAIEEWWSKARNGFELDGRYLGGKPFGTGRLVETLEHASMRRRPILSLELAIRSRGLLRIETRDLSHIQHAQMRAAQATPAGGFISGPFPGWMNG
jgi:uncharacterized protein (TIGR02270 family)